MNRMLTSCCAALMCCMVCCAQNEYRSVDAREFEKALVNDNAQLLDVRTAEEFAQGHIKGYNVKNIDIRQDGFSMAATVLLCKERIVAVYCRSGRRSLTAAEKLTEAGYKVINLKGGIIEWAEYKKEKH